MIRQSRWLQISVLCIMLGIVAIALGRVGLLRGSIAWAFYLLCPLTHTAILVVAKDNLTAPNVTQQRRGPPGPAANSTNEPEY